MVSEKFNTRLLTTLRFHLIFLLLIFTFPQVSAAEVNYSLDFKNVDYGFVSPGTRLLGNFTIYNNNNADVLNFSITVYSEITLDYDLAKFVVITAGNKKLVNFEFIAPDSGGDYVVRIKVAPSSEGISSGSVAIPAYEGYLKFTVVSLGISMFSFQSGHTSGIGHLEVININNVSLFLSGLIEYYSEGVKKHETDLDSVNIPAYNESEINYPRVRWEIATGELDDGLYTAKVMIYYNLYDKPRSISSNTGFIIGEALPIISLELTASENTNKQYATVFILAKNEGYLPYLLEFDISIKDKDSGSLYSNNHFGEIVQDEYVYAADLRIDREGVYIATVTGKGGDVSFTDSIEIESKGFLETREDLIDTITEGAEQIPLWLYILMGVNIIAFVSFILNKLRTKKVVTDVEPIIVKVTQVEPKIKKMHIFLSEGEALATYDHEKRELDEMEIEKIGQIIMSIAQINFDILDYLPVEIDATTTLYLQIRQGLGIAFELDSSSEYQRLINSARIRERVNLFVSMHGDNLRRGLVDLQIEDFLSIFEE
ncbi:MAG: hypothetical protein INQ03_20605 [Candidatus Heimdallarchaeota archaeon]|nr:hypothetical protein [Candidatus Heimdallarchaeota archaeon]